jgi:putative transposase
MMESVCQARKSIGVAPACDALSLPRASFYRWLNPSPKRARPTPKRALSKKERQAVLEICHAPDYIDKAPNEIVATLMDKGDYLCSARTMYRILEAEKEIRERRNQLRRPIYTKPELLAIAPNEVWSWDITKLKGPAKWTYFYLYVILDIFSRYVVGWMLAHRESAKLAEKLIGETCLKQGIERGRLTLHADRGSSMKSTPVALLLSDLGVTKTHSRPYVSNDNPFSESQFKTMKYRPEFPNRFGSLQDARSFCRDFFDWYNDAHRHSGIAMLTPATVHDGREKQVIENRNEVLLAAFEKHPERFVNKIPEPMKLQKAVWINPPKTEETKIIL